MIPDDDAHQFEGNKGAFKQPIIQEKSSSKFTPSPSLSGGFAGVSCYQTPPREVS